MPRTGELHDARREDSGDEGGDAMSAEWNAFFALRQRVFDAVKKAAGGKRRPSDGWLQVAREFPGYFSDEKDVLWRITLNVYSIGDPEICYTYTGKTFAEALDKAAKDIDEILADEHRKAIAE
jgi:hypothetical protein